MRTTLQLDDELLSQAKAYAASNRRTLTSVMEEALRRVLAAADQAGRRPRAELPVSGRSGGTLPGVDLTDNAALADVMAE